LGESGSLRLVQGLDAGVVLPDEALELGRAVRQLR
jgi:hypothetical protein